MKFWHINSGNTSSFYFEPFKWENLNVLFNSSSLVVVDHFIGLDPQQQSFYKSWHGSSPELSGVEGDIQLHVLMELVNDLDLYPYEYILSVGGIKIKRAIVEGAIFTGESKTIQMLIDKIEIPINYDQTRNGKLLVYDQSDTVRNEGSIDSNQVLLDHIYNDLMSKESPMYNVFMDSLDAGIIID